MNSNDYTAERTMIEDIEYYYERLRNKKEQVTMEVSSKKVTFSIGEYSATSFIGSNALGELYVMICGKRSMTYYSKRAGEDVVKEVKRKDVEPFVNVADGAEMWEEYREDELQDVQRMSPVGGKNYEEFKCRRITQEDLSYKKAKQEKDYGRMSPDFDGQRASLLFALNRGEISLEEALNE